MVVWFLLLSTSVPQSSWASFSLSNLLFNHTDSSSGSSKDNTLDDFISKTKDFFDISKNDDSSKNPSPTAVDGFRALMDAKVPLSEATVLSENVAYDGQEIPVQIEAGEIFGHYVKNGSVIEFLGIPYAAAPVGPLRFANPESYGVFTVPYHASRIAPGCPQRCLLSGRNCPQTVSEDCLYANIWAPSGTVATRANTNTSAPVLVFIHGGGFIQSHGGAYNGTRVAQKGLVVVTFNYRLGALGFLATSDLQGNYGFRDQQYLLRWVQRNIRSFGGDPARVTLGGQSAGAISTGLHLVSTQSQGLYAQAMMMSPFFGHSHLTRAESIDLIGKYFVTLVSTGSCGSNEISCLRNATVEALLEAQMKVQIPIEDPLRVIKVPHATSNGMPFTYVLDDEIPKQPRELLLSGSWYKVPVLAGYTKDEMTSFVQYFLPQIGTWTYAALMKAIFKDHVDEVMAAYPTRGEDSREVIMEWTRDMLISCPLRNVSHAFATTTSYLYRFDYKYTNMDYQVCSNYVCHGAELPLVFHGSNMFREYDLGNHTIADEHLADSVFERISSFLKTGSPQANISSTQPWPAFASPDFQMFIFDTQCSTLSALTLPKCDMWDRLGYDW